MAQNGRVAEAGLGPRSLISLGPRHPTRPTHTKFSLLKSMISKLLIVKGRSRCGKITKKELILGLRECIQLYTYLATIMKTEQINSPRNKQKAWTTRGLEPNN